MDGAGHPLQHRRRTSAHLPMVAIAARVEMRGHLYEEAKVGHLRLESAGYQHRVKVVTGQESLGQPVFAMRALDLEGRDAGEHRPDLMLRLMAVIDRWGAGGSHQEAELV